MFEEQILSKRHSHLFNPGFCRVMQRARSDPMIRRERMHELCCLLGPVEGSRVPGDHGELGTARGDTAVLLYSYAVTSSEERRIRPHDAFEALDPPDADCEEVRRALDEERRFDPERAHVVKGCVDVPVPQRPRHPIEFLPARSMSDAIENRKPTQAYFQNPTD